MEALTEVHLECGPAELSRWVDDLSAYPQWMGLVHRASREPGDIPAWTVDLRARIGPLARSKRLRMVRTTPQGPGLVRFERRELDGRHHGRWELTARYGADGGGTALAVAARYDGPLWSAGLLERALNEEIERAKVRLAALVSEARDPDGPRR